MQIYKQFLWILGFALVGQGIAYVLPLPIPGSMIGMVLLFGALKTGLLKVQAIEQVGKWWVTNMAILFLPAGVGIMANFGKISAYLWQIALIVLVALVVNLAVIAWVVIAVNKGLAKRGQS